jgi:nucleoside-diphosphate-sugar epimerase
MNVLIIGGTGLISTAITRQLLERGDSVTLFNRGRTESRVPAAARQVHGERRDYARFVAHMRELERFDCVIEMICFTPQDAESLIAALRGRAGHVIFCSTVDVYARPAGRYPITEDEPHKPASAYGRDKSRCERLLLDAHERGDFPVTVIRPAQTYGEGGGLIHTFGWSTAFLDRLRKGKRVVVHGDGTSLWCACHVDDCARAFVAAAGRQRAFGRAYHATGEEWLTWNRYHECIAEAMGWPGPALVHIPTDLLLSALPRRAAVVAENFQFNNVFDNAAARQDLDFRYTIPFAEGARRTVLWLDSKGWIVDSETEPYYDRLLAAWDRLGAGFVDEARSLEREDTIRAG